jgi:hypothetical protein
MFKFENESQRIFRKMGYYSDQNGILRRYSNEAINWKLHLENTKAFICKAAIDKQKNKAAILGSGWLLDVPIKELSEIFREVWLFDIRHTPYIYNKIKGLKNIIPVERDISGFAVPIYQIMKSAGKSNISMRFDSIKPIFDFLPEDFDFVISCNILDQLDSIPLEYIHKHYNIKIDEEILLRTMIQQEHLKLLPKLKSCVIADIEEFTLDINDQLLQIKKLIFTDIPEISNSESWLWKFDSIGSYKTGFHTNYKVAAFNI